MPETASDTAAEHRKVIPIRLKSVEFEPIDDLVAVDDNPQEHDIDGIKRSILEFGYMLPIIINLDGRIVGGHGRKTALLELRDEGYELEGGGRIPVLRGDFTEREAAVLLPGLNELQGYPDPTRLGAYINERMSELGMELADFEPAGYSLGRLEELSSLTDTMEILQEKMAKVAGQSSDGPSGAHLVIRLTSSQAYLFEAVSGWIIDDEDTIGAIAAEYGNDNEVGNAIFRMCQMIYADPDVRAEIGPIEEPVDDYGSTDEDE